MNEGKFPAGKSQNSFIPYDVKRGEVCLLLKKRCDLYVSLLPFVTACKEYLSALLPKVMV
jgi:hypothetical protein